jgi:ABC-type multidrug transport system ATPase subunit
MSESLAGMDSQPVIEARDLTIRFGSFTAVDGVSFAVEGGHIFGLLGPNGSGKSTVIRALCGLLRPAAGIGSVLGLDCVRQSEHIRESVGYMSQRFSLYPDLTVHENLTFYGMVYGLGHALAQRRAELIEMFSLVPYAHRQAGTLSGGWKQRLALACALVHSPRVVFLDEPTAGIDPVARRQLWDMLTQLAASGVTLFVTTHYMDEAARCNSLAYIYLSKLLVSGSPAKLKSDPRVTPDGSRWLELQTEHPADLMPRIAGQEHLDNISVFGSAIHFRASREVTNQQIDQVAGMPVSPGEPTLEDVFVMLTNEAEQGRLEVRT